MAADPTPPIPHRDNRPGCALLLLLFQISDSKAAIGAGNKTHLEDCLSCLWMLFTDEGVADADVGEKVHHLLPQLRITLSPLSSRIRMQAPIRLPVHVARSLGE